MHKRELLARVSALAQPICDEAGLSLWDVQFEKEGRGYMLTVFIDRAEGGVFIDDCEGVSRALDPLLDTPEFDRLPAYTLSVSSAGIQRRLTRPEHYAWAVGRAVEVSFYKAEALGETAVGALLGFDSAVLRLELGGEAVEIPREKISGVRIHFQF